MAKTKAKAKTKNNGPVVRDRIKAQAIAADLMAVCKKHSVRLYPTNRWSLLVEDMFGVPVWEVYVIDEDSTFDAEMGESYDND